MSLNGWILLAFQVKGEMVGRCAECALVECMGSTLHSQHVLMAHLWH